MFQNYVKIAFRNLWKRKGYSFINILGLTIGMASAMLIMLWIQNELSYDSFYEKSDRIYTMYNRDSFNNERWAWNNTPKIMAPTLKHDYPEVEDAVRYNNITFLATVGEKKLNIRGAFADSGFLQMFNFPLVNGNAAQALKGNYNIVLTQKMATKLFGNDDPMGKAVRIDSNAIFTVSAVMKDLPPNTSFDFEYLLPWSFMDKLGWNDQSWGNNSVYTYVTLKPGTSQTAFDAKIKNITISHAKESTTTVFSYLFSKKHLYGKSDNGNLVGGQIETVRLFAIIGGFILLIACINFMNLSTARSEKRAKEVGIRKVAGALKGSLMAQFIGESILLSAIAFILALITVQLCLHPFNDLVGKQLAIAYNRPAYWLFALLFIIFTGFLAGSYPAFYLSSFTPVKVLKGTFKKVNALVTPRKVLVVLQFTFAIILIISTIIVQRQIQFAQNRDAGYDRNNLVFVFTQGNADKNYQLIKNDLLRSGAVVSVTKSANPITQRWSDSWGYSWEGATETDKKLDFVRLGSDANFIQTIGVKLKEGRDIDVYNFPTDSSAVLLNESAVTAMHVTKPLGMIIKSENTSWHVVGIVKDFILESPFEKKVGPVMVMGPGNEFFQIIHFKLNKANSTSSNLAKMEKVFKQYNPEYPFEYVFADESYANKFREQQRTGTLATLFAALTIFISCLGLFGLATYMAENRIKEIGVRKVLGASVFSITSLLSKDFLKLVASAMLIASPIAWWAMRKWLENYSYHVQIEWWVFAGAGLLAILIALLTVSYQSVKAAVANPVKSLRTE